LLVRLGLRAGDVAQLRLDDIEWETGSLRVSGKSRYEVRLPLPQDVGDAIAAYIACRPSTCPSDHVFLRNIAPLRPFRNGDGISSVVKRLMRRAGDVAQLRLDDIEWETGSLRVSGKSRYEVRLPLPQDVGDAIAAYLACRPSTCPSDHVFLRNIAPFRPFRKGDGISSAVKRLMQRAGIVAPVKGAHVLRHTAATEMLRHGVPLEKIGLVLRHRGIDTTAYYAKADVTLLKQIAQPWPEVL
ncbi:MAG: tyrosine-type recombinase/integrase, partial [Rhodoplanes sp.]